MHFFLYLYKKKGLFKCSNNLPSKASLKSQNASQLNACRHTGFPTARSQDNSFAFSCYSYEETVALDFIHRNYIQTKTQWFSIFSARNYYIKIFVSNQLKS